MENHELEQDGIAKYQLLVIHVKQLCQSLPEGPFQFLKKRNILEEKLQCKPVYFFQVKEIDLDRSVVVIQWMILFRDRSKRIHFFQNIIQFCSSNVDYLDRFFNIDSTTLKHTFPLQQPSMFPTYSTQIQSMLLEMVQYKIR